MATPAGAVRLRTAWRPGDVVVDVESANGTLVVLGETRSRGWHATLDGAPATVYPVNDLFQSVAVPAGRLRLRWTFASPGVGWGVALWALGVVGLAAAWRLVPRGAAAAALVLLGAIVGVAPASAADAAREIAQVRLTHPNGVAVAPDGAVWITSTFLDRLTRFDPRDGGVREIALPLNSRPVGLFVAPSGAVWYAASGLGRIGRWDPQRAVLDEFALPSLAQRHLSGFPGPWMLALEPTRNEVWFTEHSGGLLASVDASARPVHRAFVVRELPLGDYTTRPDGIAADGDGRVWVAETGADRLARIDPRDRSVHHLALTSGSRPRQLVRGPDGAIWVSLFGSHELLRVDPRTERRTVWRLPSAPRSNPEGLALDQKGNVWVSESSADTIVRLEPATGRFRVVRLPTPGARVRALAIDAVSRVWFVGSNSGRLGVIDP